MPTLGILATALAEQLLIGVANFAISWSALRTLTPHSIFVFSAAWMVLWGTFAVLSESALRAARLKTIRKPESRDLVQVSIATRRLALSLIALSILLASAIGSIRGTATLAIATLACLLGAVSFHSARAFGQAQGRTKDTLFAATLYATVNALGLVLLYQHTASPEALLSVAGVALSLGSLPAARTRAKPGDFAAGARQLPVEAWRGRVFALSTGLRVALFSVLLIAMIRGAQGVLAAALFAAAQVLVSPSQLVSSTLPWTLLPRLARLAPNSPELQREFLRQTLAYITLAASSGLALALVWGFWVQQSVTNPVLLQQLNQSKPAILAMLGAMIMTSASSSLMQAHNLRWAQLASVVVGGAAGLTMAALGINPIWSVATTYAVAFGVGIALSLQTLKDQKQKP